VNVIAGMLKTIMYSIPLMYHYCVVENVAYCLVYIGSYCCKIFQKFDDLWDLLDAESTSFMAYEDFMRYYLGEMNEYRKYLVIKV